MKENSIFWFFSFSLYILTIFISLKVLRDIRQDVLENKDKGESYPITGFIIEDNGIGFNENNYNSFLTKSTLNIKYTSKFNFISIYYQLNF